MKRWICSFCLLALAAALLLYFWPIRLSDRLSSTAYVILSHQRFSVENGRPRTETDNYHEISQQQLAQMIEALRRYTCHRTLATPFSDGPMSIEGDWLLYLYAYDEGDRLTVSLSLTEGRVRIDQKVYALPKADALLEELLRIVRG